MSALDDLVNQLQQTTLKPSHEDIANYKKILAMFPHWRREIQQAKLAGFDVSNQERMLEDTCNKIEKMLQAYDTTP